MSFVEDDGDRETSCADGGRIPLALAGVCLSETTAAHDGGSVVQERRVETALYLPVKRFLEDLGYTVKGEIGRCDLVALKDDDPAVVVIGELKLSFNLELILQGVDRMSLGNEIWLAAPLSARGKGRESDPRYRNLCRRLGFGLLGVAQSGRVDVLVSPAAPTPRKDPRRRSKLVEEHRRRQGDPVLGGSTRKPMMTAYRQQALACAAAMTVAPQRPCDLKQSFPDAQKILRRNVYGWFERLERGVYALTETGRSALATWVPAPPPADPNGASA
jgi:hypothetical protein